MDYRVELRRDERWEYLKKISHEKSTNIPWDRMVLPPHSWFDEVKTLDTTTYKDNGDIVISKGFVVKVPRYRDELDDIMKLWLDVYNTYQKK